APPPAPPHAAPPPPPAPKPPAPPTAAPAERPAAPPPAAAPSRPPAPPAGEAPQRRGPPPGATPPNAAAPDAAKQPPAGEAPQRRGPPPGAPGATPPNAGTPGVTPPSGEAPRRGPPPPPASANPPPAAAPTPAPSAQPQAAPTSPNPSGPAVAPGARQPGERGPQPGAPAGGPPPRPQAGPGAPGAGPAVAPPPGQPQPAQPQPGQPTAGPAVVPPPPPPPAVTAPIPAAPPPPQALTPIAPGAQAPGPRNLSDFRSQRREVNENGRIVITEPGRIIVRDPSGQEFIRHNEVDRFRYGARDIRVDDRGDERRTIVIRPDGSEIINVTGRDGQLLRRIRRDRDGREIIIIDNSYGPRDRANFYVDLPPPVIRIPRDRYIVDYEDASPELIYETLEAPPVERIERRYTMDEIRYSPAVRQRMPSIDLNTINFDTGSWDIPPDQAAKLQVIADGLNRAIQRNPREVFLIEGHTDAVGNDTDNLSLSDRRAEAAAALLTQQFGVPAENLTSQGYGEQYLKIQTQAPERQNRRVTIRRITPLLNGGQASLPPPPPGVAPPR
ncbi:OmpA family protein, partial [Rhodopseudomonas sp. G2_2311]|uniref:OmpA family protein n=1 Tax=Rhodopseudomonas sp. G2_2311 TaxID=3114287 RepID=UPI0039C69DF2